MLIKNRYKKLTKINCFSPFEDYYVRTQNLQLEKKEKTKLKKIK